MGVTVNRRGFIKALALVPIGAIAATKLPSDEVIKVDELEVYEDMDGPLDLSDEMDHHVDTYSYVFPNPVLERLT